MPCNHCDSYVGTLEGHSDVRDKLLALAATEPTLDAVCDALSASLPSVLSLCHCRECRGIDRTLVEEIGDMCGLESIVTCLTICGDAFAAGELVSESHLSAFTLTLSVLHSLCFVTLDTCLKAPQKVPLSIMDNALVLITVLAVNGNSYEPSLLLYTMTVATSIGQLPPVNHPPSPGNNTNNTASTDSSGKSPTDVNSLTRTVSSEDLANTAVWALGHAVSDGLQHHAEALHSDSETFLQMRDLLTETMGQMKELLAAQATQMVTLHLVRQAQNPKDRPLLKHCLDFFVFLASPMLMPCSEPDINLPGFSVVDSVLSAMTSVSSSLAGMGEDVTAPRIIAWNAAAQAYVLGLSLLGEYAQSRGGDPNRPSSLEPAPEDLVRIVHEAVACITTHMSKWRQQWPIVQVDHGALPSGKCRHGCLCMVSHQFEGSMDMVTIASIAVLLQWANPHGDVTSGLNSSDSNGDTVLHKLARAGFLDLVSSFVSLAGPELDLQKKNREELDLQKKNCEGKDALMLARLSEAKGAEPMMGVHGPESIEAFLTLAMQHAGGPEALQGATEGGAGGLLMPEAVQHMTVQNMGGGGMAVQNMDVVGMAVQNMGGGMAVQNMEVQNTGGGMAVQNMAVQNMGGGIAQAPHGDGGATGEGGSLSAGASGAAGDEEGAISDDDNDKGEEDPDLKDVPDERPSRFLWLGKVHPRPNKVAMETLFGVFGTLESIRLFPGRTYAFVQFQSPASAIMAKVTLNGHVAPNISGTKRLIIRFQKDAPPLTGSDADDPAGAPGEGKEVEIGIQ
eukprot:gene2712-12583_t